MLQLNDEKDAGIIKISGRNSCREKREYKVCSSIWYYKFYANVFISSFLIWGYRHNLSYLVLIKQIFIILPLSNIFHEIYLNVLKSTNWTSSFAHHASMSKSQKTVEILFKMSFHATRYLSWITYEETTCDETWQLIASLAKEESLLGLRQDDSWPQRLLKKCCTWQPAEAALWKVKQVPLDSCLNPQGCFSTLQMSATQG